MTSAAGSSLCLFIYRALSIQTFKAVMQLFSSPVGQGVQIAVETGDALISRARSKAASAWLRNTQSDVFVQCDDDFYFEPEGYAALVEQCRKTRGIVAGVTPLRSGEYCAIVPLDDSIKGEPWRDPDCPPMDIKWAGGLIAFHRSVFEAMTQQTPLLHKNDSIDAFWPFFMPAMTSANGEDIYLSEDYAAIERARKLGFQVTVCPQCQVWHAAEVMVTTGNMDSVRVLYNDPTCGMPVREPVAQ